MTKIGMKVFISLIETAGWHYYAYTKISNYGAEFKNHLPSHWGYKLKNQYWESFSKRISYRYYILDLIFYTPRDFITFKFVPTLLQPQFTKMIEIFWSPFQIYLTELERYGL